MLGGVTWHMLPHLPGVPHLHVNRPLNVTDKCFLFQNMIIANFSMVGGRIH